MRLFKNLMSLLSAFVNFSNCARDFISELDNEAIIKFWLLMRFFCSVFSLLSSSNSIFVCLIFLKILVVFFAVHLKKNHKTFSSHHLWLQKVVYKLLMSVYPFFESLIIIFSRYTKKEHSTIQFVNKFQHLVTYIIVIITTGKTIK